ncbi:MAG TPA: hypothetical protein VI072_08985 [Polyangiaceae bacterium]
MKTMALRKLLGMGFVITAFAAGCVITSDDDDDDDGNGGTSGSGGSAGRGGSSGSGGKAGTGGKAGSDGGGGKVSCSDPIDVDDAGERNTCRECIQRDCCAEYLECFNNDPTCAQRMEDIQECIWALPNPSDTDGKGLCFSEHGETNSAASALFGCIDMGDKGDAATVDGCVLECFEGEPI